MIVVPVKEGDNIEKALKKFKRKFEKTGVVKELRRRFSKNLRTQYTENGTSDRKYRDKENADFIYTHVIDQFFHSPAEIFRFFR